MTRFLQKSKLAIPVLAALIAQACTEVDKRLGEDFLPPNQELKVQVRDATGFFTMKNVRLDSMPTSSFSIATLGRLNDDRLGKTSAGFAAQFLPASYSFEFEEGVTGFDSVCFVLGFSSTYGSDNTPMTVEVYELSEDLSIDSVYYGTPDVANRISKSVNVAASGSITAESSSARIKLTDSDELFDRLFSHTSSADSFLTCFKGLYVKVKDDEAGGCIKSVSLVNNMSSYSYASSAIVAYYHYEYTDSDSIKRDSVTSFTFHAFSTTPRFNVFEHNNDHLKSATDTLYMQGLLGVATQLEVREDSLAAWTGTGAEKKNYAISRAELVLHVLDENDYATLDAYATQLQCIVELSSSASAKYAAIGDMYASDGSLSSAFDGALNRSLMQYSLNITHYFNSAVKSGAASPLILIPYSYTSDASSALVNNTDKKPQLKITYVEIKR
jgi:hypothetical protein